MPEIKNNFIQGKMNKDLDDRLLPNGQYRDAQNIIITKSDDSDVGVLQNVKGNKKPYTDSVNVLANNPNAEVIGVYVDNQKERVFYFVTDRSTGVLSDLIGPPGSSGNPLASSFTFHGIYYWSQSSGNVTPKLIVQGAFLNFSKDYLITGINIIDDILFFTDNLNQPRRINVQTAIDDASFYNSEAKISVAKFAPFYPIRLLDSSNVSTMSADSDVDSDFLKNQFVRFSYRFKYDDGEFSTMAPFTQAVFIPKIYQDGATGLTATQKTKIFETAEVEDMVNFINKAVFKIQMPSTSATVLKDNNIKKIQLLSRVDGDLSVRVVDELDASITTVTDGIINYTYKSFQPFKTLPEDQTTRVFDNVPLRAKSQEIVSNRVVYGNFTEKRSLVNTIIDFDADTSTKNNVTSTNDDYLYNEYKYHSVKQRRNYQVGIVLSDIFGRQTPVLLPISNTTKTSTERSSVYVPAKDPTTFNSSNWQNYDNTESNTVNWGDVLRIRFNQPISNAYSRGNPFGWYSYRVVVKQQEQEYYNVYTTGMHRAATNIGFITLNGDNVNKIPRDVTDVNRDTGVAGSEARIFPKVINFNNASNANIASILSNGDLFDVTEVGTLTEFGYDPTAVATLANFYGSNTNVNGLGDLYVAKLPADQLRFPAMTAPSRQGGIAIFETEPFNSKLDIFYETSSSGLISDLNTAVSNSLTGISSITSTLLFNNGGTGLTEATTSGSNIFEVFANNASGIQNATLELLSVFDLQNNDVGSSFEFDPLTNKVKTLTTFYYGENGNEYSFRFKSTFGGEDFIEIINISLQNVVPVINFPINPIPIEHTTNIGGLVGEVRAENGTADQDFKFSDMEFILVSQTNNAGTYALSQSGDITTTTELISDKSDTLTIKVIDSDGITESGGNTLTINTTSSTYKPFYISSIGYASTGLAQNQETSVLRYHDGDGDTPIKNDFVYEYYAGALVLTGLYSAFDTEGKFYTMSKNPSTSALLSFKSDSDGKVTDISTQ